MCGLVGNSNKVIIVGGYTSTNQKLDSSEILSFGSKFWEIGASLPNALASSSIVGYKGTLLISGGNWNIRRGEIYQVK